MEAFPRGELDFSEDELAWAWRERSKLPRNKPVALVAPGSITDEAKLPASALYWTDWVDSLARELTIVQAPSTKASVLEEVVRLTERQRKWWRPDPILDNAYLFENLSLRLFLALFAVVDLYLDRNSGGSHVAAAMNVPAIIALPRSRYPDVPTFPDPASDRPWRHESFLYPYHSFLLQH
jgi:ADP-heptose:LPS heptosyltransferase